MFLEIEVLNSYVGSSRLCVVIFAYEIVKCLLGKTFRTILRIFYQYQKSLMFIYLLLFRLSLQ
ncbi:MAG: hypothetical protein EWV92_07475 [Microcystis aeruginosa Ma_MB_S_20031200_S102]|uniref:Uncharacterized protein n=1 Tax=Microcystis aeruginosa Ma_MB_S_20031200_S102 TaxID=2486254 RepID=A0A552EWM1_MICAE|nr:MAG: hypothetical protein EWV79_15000 [Microcystis aeruginosa Ma_MB_S_20031200_S102D]TRU38874.1 MAG: hypothetical protein EWV92_07475 [Microcystis aeruginosa Ma_MB_S_20031200_S102]